MKKTPVHNRFWKAVAVRVCGVLLVLAPCAVLGTTVEASESPFKIATESGEYRLMPGDKLGVLVFEQDHLSGNFVINGAGEIMLPLVGTAKVAGLTVGEAKQLIEKRLSDGILTHPAVSVSVAEFRPIFVTGYVRRPGNYPFIYGMSVKAAIATAGGEGPPGEVWTSAAAQEADAIMADERVRQLETERLALFVRKARLECQRDEKAKEFIMPQHVGFKIGNGDLISVYAAEHEAFTRLVEGYQSQLKALQEQGPRIAAQVQAVNAQIDDVKQRLRIVNDRLAEYEDYADRGYLRKQLVVEIQIQKSTVQLELSRLAAELAHLGQIMGDLEVRKEEVKANYRRQILSELQDTSQRLLNIDATLGTARQLRRVRALQIGFTTVEYAVQVTRSRPDNVTAFDATGDTKLEPGDVVEIKRLQNELESSYSTEAGLHNMRQEFGPVEQQATFASYCSETTEASKDSKSITQTVNSEDDEQFSGSGNNSAAAEEQPATAASGRVAVTDTVARAIIPERIFWTVEIGFGRTPPLVSASAEIKEPPAARPHPVAPKATSKREAVKAIQHTLRELGYSLTVDGVIGPITIGAIEDALAKVQYQSAQRPADGLGGATLLASSGQE